MKKKWIACVAMLCLLLSGCAAPHLEAEQTLAEDTVALPEATPAPTKAQETATPVPQTPQVGQVEYAPGKAPSAFNDEAVFSTQLYVLLVQSIRQGSETADMSTLTVTDEQFEGVRAYLLSRNPWGTLTDITRKEDGTIRLAYSVKDEAERRQAAADFDAAAAQLLKEAVPTGSSETAAAISLYKAVAQRIAYDYEAEDGGLYDALVHGKGLDYSYAYLYSFLLDQVEIPNVVVFSEDSSHAWNVVTLGENSYHCDPQYESGLNAGQALHYFGLSDHDMTQMNGWNTWTSENHQLLSCDQTMLTDVQLAAFADVDAAGNGVFFTEMSGRNGVFRLDLEDGSVLEVVDTAQPSALAVLGENVYYINSVDQLLYRYRTGDGDVRQAIENVPVASIKRVGTELIYVQDNAEQTENTISMN